MSALEASEARVVDVSLILPVVRVAALLWSVVQVALMSVRATLLLSVVRLTVGALALVLLAVPGFDERF